MPKIDLPYTYRVINLDLINGLNDEHFSIHAESIYYHWGTSTLEVKLNAASNDIIKMRPKNRIDAPVRQIFITAPARNETVQLFLANPKDIMLGGGEIRVLTDQGYINSVTQFAYYGGFEAAAVAATNSYICFSNGHDSDFLIVDYIEIMSNTTGNIGLTFLTPAGYCGIPPYSYGQNKYGGGNTSLANVHGVFSRKWAGAVAFCYLTHVTANIPTIVNLNNYIIVPPDYNAEFFCYTANASLLLTLHWRAESFIPQ